MWIGRTFQYCQCKGPTACGYGNRIHLVGGERLLAAPVLTALIVCPEFIVAGGQTEGGPAIRIGGVIYAQIGTG